MRLENLTPRKLVFGSDLSDLFRVRPELIRFVDGAVRRVELGVRLQAGNVYGVTVTALQHASAPPRVDNYCSIGAGQKEFKAGPCDYLYTVSQKNVTLFIFVLT